MTEMDANIFTHLIFVGGQIVHLNIELLEEFELQQNGKLKEFEKLIQTRTAMLMADGVSRDFARQRAEREANEWLREENKRIFERDSKLNYTEWRKALDRLIELTPNFQRCAMNVAFLDPHHSPSAAEMYDEVNNDGSILSRIAILMANVDEEDWPKVEQAIRRIGKKNHRLAVDHLCEYYPIIKPIKRETKNE